jgi:hypothetical protein
MYSIINIAFNILCRIEKTYGSSRNIIIIKYIWHLNAELFIYLLKCIMALFFSTFSCCTNKNYLYKFLVVFTQAKMGKEILVIVMFKSIISDTR